MQIIIFAALCVGLAQAHEPDEAEVPEEVQRAMAFEASLDKQTGVIDLGRGLAGIDTGERYVYLPPDDTSRLLEAWGNPPGTESLGAILPAQGSDQLSQIGPEMETLMVATTFKEGCSPARSS